ncbi:glycerol-3-phosphate acyltransferase [Sporosarcina sp. FA9]|uniref:glycerol-3-phosphate acyltransferase n=1 Tax=Sporosarcina sp. FA9 TaxID=3413030 RepID=UPI003F65A293
MYTWFFFIMISGYFIGCIHGSVIAQRLSGVNLKTAGVKNAGASNATIVLGLKFGALVAAIDIGKAFFPVIALKIIIERFELPKEMTWILLFILSASIIIGHIYPFYMKFSGGKGTATVIGVLLSIDWRFGLIALGLFVVISLATDFLIFGVLILYITFIALAVFNTPGIYPVIIAIGLFLIAVSKHVENIKRLIIGEEPRVSSVLKKKG